MTLDKIKTKDLPNTVGWRVRCIREFPVVQVGSEGSIAEFYKIGKGRCGVTVAWDRGGAKDDFGRDTNGSDDETKFLEVIGEPRV